MNTEWSKTFLLMSEILLFPDFWTPILSSNLEKVLKLTCSWVSALKSRLLTLRKKVSLTVIPLFSTCLLKCLRRTNNNMVINMLLTKLSLSLTLLMTTLLCPWLLKKLLKDKEKTIMKNLWIELVLLSVTVTTPCMLLALKSKPLPLKLELLPWDLILLKKISLHGLKESLTDKLNVLYPLMFGRTITTTLLLNSPPLLRSCIS